MRFINQIKYPTKEEILKKDPIIAEKIFHLIKVWKREEFKGWKEKTNEKKLESIKRLVCYITVLNYAKLPNFGKSNNDCYDPKTKTIFLNTDNPSIITALHETAHFLFGKSELTACRWSIYLFRTCFPGLFNKLTWEGHMLVKKK